MKTPFIHLNVHSNYSLLSGASRIEELLNRARELGFDALALTDTNGLYGVIPFIAGELKRIRPMNSSDTNFFA